MSRSLRSFRCRWRNGEHSDLLVRATEEPLADGHGGLTPWNLLLGERWVFIDWDGAAAGTRLWDLAYSAQAFTLNDTSVDLNVAGQSLRAFVDGYRAEAELLSVIPDVLAQRTWAMYEMLGDAHRDGAEPWGTTFLNGHGDHWRAVAEYVERGVEVWGDAIRVGP